MMHFAEKKYNFIVSFKLITLLHIHNNYYNYRIYIARHRDVTSEALDVMIYKTYIMHLKYLYSCRS